MKRIIIIVFFAGIILSYGEGIEQQGIYKAEIIELDFSSFYKKKNDSLIYHPAKAFDNKADTAWFPDPIELKNMKYGFIKITLDKEIIIDTIEVLPGWFGEKWWDYNNRIKQLKIITENTSFDLAFDDIKKPQIKKLKQPISFKVIEFQIKDVYKSEHSDFSCISDISFYYKGNKINISLQHYYSPFFIKKKNALDYQPENIIEYINKRHFVYMGEKAKIDLNGDGKLEEIEVSEKGYFSVNGKEEDYEYEFFGFELIDLDQQDFSIELILSVLFPGGTSGASHIVTYQNGNVRLIQAFEGEAYINRDGTLSERMWNGFFSVKVTYTYNSQTGTIEKVKKKIQTIEQDFEVKQKKFGFDAGDSVTVKNARMINGTDSDSISTFLSYEEFEYEILLKDGSTIWISFGELDDFIIIMWAG